jgi:hypothetical protein
MWKFATRAGLLSVLMIAGIASSSIGQVPPQRDTIRTDVDLVVIPASVKDGNGRFIHDLEQQDFRILEDGRPQQIHVYSGRTQDAMQNAFSLITEQARHQYVLSYVSNNEASGPLPVLRKVEVQTTRSGLKVHHRTQYLQYPSRR